MLGAGSASEVLERAAKRAARIALMDSCGLESEELAADRTGFVIAWGLNKNHFIFIPIYLSIIYDYYRYVNYKIIHLLFNNLLSFGNAWNRKHDHRIISQSSWDLYQTICTSPQISSVVRTAPTTKKAKRVPPDAGWFGALATLMSEANTAWQCRLDFKCV